MVLKMEQGGFLQQQLPIHNEYNLTLEPECSDHCGGAVQHDTYANSGGIEVIRRDSAVTGHIPASFTYAHTHANSSNRYLHDRSIGDATHSASISTSPSSAASSLAYTSYPGAHYTSVQHLPGPVQLSQGFVPSTFAETRTPTFLDTPTHMLPPPQRALNALSQPLENRDTFSASSTPFLNRTQLSTPSFAAYPYAYAETPRSLLSSTATLSLSPGTSPYSNVHMAGSGGQNYGQAANECANFPWSDLVSVNDIECEGQLLVPKITATIEKGFFLDIAVWTCYRRNYFSVGCNFELHPCIPNGRLTIRRGNTLERVQAMGMRLSAAVDGTDGKNIELIQHTPKRDLGPKTKIEVVKVAPKLTTNRAEQTMVHSRDYQMPLGSYHPHGQQPGPYLPLQASSEPDTQAGASQSSQLSSQLSYGSSTQPAMLNGTSNECTFDRVQFKQATANNGKRRATQQFFHLIVELFADVRKNGSDKPIWVKVAQRSSDKIVVRGRSPSHYLEKSDESGSNNRPIQSGGSAGYTIAGNSYASLNAGAFRSTPNTYIAANGVGLRKGELYSDHGSQSDSSSSSLEEHNIEASYTNDTVMTDAERVALHEHDGYQYYPSAMYEHVQSTLLPPIAKLNGDNGYLNDSSKLFAVKPEYVDTMAGAQYQAAPINRFQGVDTSRGYFPDLQRF